MSQIGVVYATKTKHSQKLAEAIGLALHVRSENVTSNPAPFPSDLLFIVGGIYAGKSNPDLIQYIKNLNAAQVKKAVLVTSSVSTRKRSQPDARALLKGNGIEVVDEITCPGSFLFIKMGHPNATEIQKVAERAKQIAQQI